MELQNLGGKKPLVTPLGVSRKICADDGDFLKYLRVFQKIVDKSHLTGNESMNDNGSDQWYSSEKTHLQYFEILN